MEDKLDNGVWDNFTNLYPISKTLRFELKPLGKTLSYIKEQRIIEKDEKKAKEFLKVKEIMNDYCRELIKEHLINVNLDCKKLNEFKDSFLKLRSNKIDSKLKKGYREIIGKIGKELYDQANFKEIEFDDKHFIKNLKNWLQDNNRSDNLNLIQSFDGFSVYFKGFFENRKNVFKVPTKDDDEAISTSVVYRTINENLTCFLDNCLKFEELKKLDIDFSEVEKNFDVNLKDFIKLENYNSFLTQEGIDKFNLILGGQISENGTKLKGINEIINLESQKEKDKTKSKNIRKKKLKQLYKQILSKSDKIPFSLEKLKDDKEFIGLIKNTNKENEFDEIEKLFNSLLDYDLTQIWIKNDESLKNISQELFSDWGMLKRLIIEYKFSEKTDKQKEELSKKENIYFSIEEIEKAILNKKGIFDLEEDKKSFNEKINNNFEHPIIGYFQRFGFKDKNLLNEVRDSYNSIKEILDKEYCDGIKDFLQKSKESEVEKIKLFLDNSLEILRFIKLLNYKRGKADDWSTLEVDEDFYEKYFNLINEVKEIVGIYDKARNYVSQKPFSKEKFKLNFDNSTLAKGWDKNKESDNYTILLRKDNNYYLGIMTQKENNLFRKIPKNETNDFYEKMEYKLLPSPNKMLPKVFFSDRWKFEHKIPKEILDIYKNNTFTKGDNFNIEDCRKLIDYYKENIDIHPEWSSYFNFRFRDTNEYSDIGQFYREVQNQGYSINFVDIDSKTINQYVDEGRLYLFQIYNKDFSDKKSETNKKSRKNLHTLYWNALFSEENLKEVIFKLNGEAELFFREKSIQDKDKKIHPKNQDTLNKDPINNKKYSKFNYDLIKNKRYTEDKFFFYCPITINFKANGNEKTLNKKIIENIRKNHPQIKSLGVDRGERNLAYYSLVNQEGVIEKQGTFNIIQDKFGREVNYQEKLDKIEGERNEARKNWKKIENIKEMKSGYLSQIVHQISKLAIENNAIIVFEDLSWGFKRGRFKIEKQIYQKFEKMLIEKFNYLMFKDKEENEIGGLMKAYQLTSKFESFKKMGKQAGILFYVNANYTSKMDPKTGFVNLLYPKYGNEKQAKEFLKKFDSIKYNKEKDYFEFEFDYRNFKINEKENMCPSKTDWKVYSFGERLHQQRKQNSKSWETIKIKLTENLKVIFDNTKINYFNEGDIKEEILKQNNAKFFKELIFLMNKMLQLRNSNEKEDYILSCVQDSNEEFFDSRKAKDDEPIDADANGAYNIARKGLIILDRIKNSEGNKPDLKISNKDFFNYINGNSP